jgi:hypothetical protein
MNITGRWIQNALVPLFSSTSQGEARGNRSRDGELLARESTSNTWDSFFVHGLYSGAILGGVGAGAMWWLRNHFRSKISKGRRLQESKMEKEDK